MKTYSSSRPRHARPTTVSAALVAVAAPLIEEMYETVRLNRAFAAVVEAEKILADAGFDGVEFVLARERKRAGGAYVPTLTPCGKSKLPKNASQDARRALGRAIESLADALALLINQPEYRLRVGFAGWVDHYTAQIRSTLDARRVSDLTATGLGRRLTKRDALNAVMTVAKATAPLALAE